jgi:hypothetical protein
VLVEVGADTEALVTADGMKTKITALQLAVCQGKLDAIRVLAQCGANVDASTDDDDGNKAVHLTVINDQVDVDGNWERICQPRLYRLEQVCSSCMSANNSSVCVNGFTPLQLSVEYENAAVERVDQAAAAHLSTTTGCVCGRWWWRHRSSGVHAASVSSTAAKSVSAHTGARTSRSPSRHPIRWS